MNRFLLIAIILLLLSVCSFAQTEGKRLERLSGLAKVWGTVKFFHPYPAYKEIDWDKALVEAIPRVNESKTPTEYAAAVNSMLAVLGDAQTRALIKASGSNSSNEFKSPDIRATLRIENGILFYDALRLARATMANPEKAGELSENFEKLLANAKAVVIDGAAGCITLRKIIAG